MKGIVRAFVFSYISLYIVQQLLSSFRFGEGARSYLLVVVALSLVSIFAVPVLRVVSFSSKGFGRFFINFIVTLITLYVLTISVPSFSIVEASVPPLVFFGFGTPYIALTQVWSLVVSALLFSLVYSMFGWLVSKRR